MTSVPQFFKVYLEASISLKQFQLIQIRFALGEDPYSGILEVLALLR